MIANPMEHKNKLLQDRRDGKITMEELQKECAYWFLDCFDTIHTEPEPPAPADYLDFMRLPFERRNKMAESFYQDPKIKLYLENKEKIKNRNSANILRLKEFKEAIPQEDFVAHQKFKEKLSELQNKNYGF